MQASLHHNACTLVLTLAQVFHIFLHAASSSRGGAPASSSEPARQFSRSVQGLRVQGLAASLWGAMCSPACWLSPHSAAVLTAHSVASCPGLPGFLTETSTMTSATCAAANVIDQGSTGNSSAVFMAVQASCTSQARWGQVSCLDAAAISGNREGVALIACSGMPCIAVCCDPHSTQPVTSKPESQFSVPSRACHYVSLPSKPARPSLPPASLQQLARPCNQNTTCFCPASLAPTEFRLQRPTCPLLVYHQCLSSQPAAVGLASAGLCFMCLSAESHSGCVHAIRH